MNLNQQVEYKVNTTQLENDKGPFSFSFLSIEPSIDIDPNPIFYQDKMGKLMGCNKSFEQIIGRSRVEVIGKSLSELFKRQTVDAFNLNFQEVLQSHLVNRFITPMEGCSQVTHSYLATMTYFSTEGCGEIVVSALTDISFITNNVVARPDELRGEMNLTRSTMTSCVELVMCSERMKNQVIEWLNTLRGHLSDDGKCFLTSIMTKLKIEFLDGLDFISERLFDEKHQALYELLDSLPVRLTKYEMRLCALLNLNYSLVEIAKLTRRSANSINVAFNRIRMKLGISSNGELKYFLAVLNN